MAVRTVSQLRKGEKGIIKSFTNKDLSLKLLEMGCLPGAEVCLFSRAPLGDPICLNVAGYCLAMRKSEASTILIDN